MRSIRIVLLLLAPFLCGACGLLLTHGPPAGHGSLTKFRCTTSVVGPAVDAVLATLSVVVALKSVATTKGYDPDANLVLEVGILRAAIWGVTSAIGFERISKCAVAKRQLAERNARAAGGAGTRTVEVAPAADTLMVGDSIQLVAKALSGTGGVFVSKTFRWSSSNGVVASVSDAGLVTAHAPGTALIAANADNVIGTARVVVVSARQ